MADPSPELRCWARRDNAPPFEALTDDDGVTWTEHGWGWSCGEPPCDDLGLCAHHRAAILGPPVAVGSPMEMQPATRASILAWLEQNAAGSP